MSPSEPPYLLRWKGANLGPFTLAEIQARLFAGEISRVHQVQGEVGWELLDDFLVKHKAATPSRGQAGSLENRSALTPWSPDRAEDHPTFLEPHVVPRGSGEPARTSGLAIAALVCALCNFIPYLNFISWILALIFGHTALAHLHRDPHLQGRGMALAGLIITYFLIVMLLTFGALMLYHHRPAF